MKCEKHPKYQAKRKPRSNCDPCWQMYFKKQARKRRAPILPTQVHEDRKKQYKRSREKRKWQRDIT